MSFRIDDEKLLQKYKDIWTNIEDIRNIELNTTSLRWYIYIYIYKVRTYSSKFYTNFRGLIVSENDNSDK